MPMPSIFHPTDLSQASEVAFVHALKLTLGLQGKLTVFHVTDNVDSVGWGDLPGVRNTLERWGLIPAGSERDVVATLGIDIRKTIGNSDDPVASSTRYLEDHPTDMVVLATRANQGRMSWFGGSVSKPLARQSGAVISLFLPHGVDGFVDRQTGDTNLKKVLIPAATSPHPRLAINAVARLAEMLDLTDLEVTLLYIGADASAAPAVDLPEVGQWSWEVIEDDGNKGDIITAFANENEIDLVSMTTEGPNGFLDALRGTTTERVMRGVSCPLLAVAAGAR